MRVSHGLPVLLLGLGLASCRNPVIPERYFPHTAVPLEPVPAIYRTWWDEIEACSGRKGDFRSLSFYVVPDADGWWDGRVFIEGAWVSRGNRITVGERRSLIARILRHEMLHALLRTGEHPAEFFTTKCGSLVARSSP